VSRMLDGAGCCILLTVELFSAWAKFENLDANLAKRISDVDAFFNSQRPEFPRRSHICPFCSHYHFESLHECLWLHGGQPATQKMLTNLQSRNDPRDAWRVSELSEEMYTWPVRR
jgi:hypothetical protein